MRKCKLFFCDEPHNSKGYCQKHYASLRRHGSPLSPYKKDVLKMFNIITLARQIIGDKILTEEEESMRKLMKTFLDNTSGDGERKLCEKCKQPVNYLTDGKTFLLKDCGCDKEPILIGDVYGE